MLKETLTIQLACKIVDVSDTSHVIINSVDGD